MDIGEHPFVERSVAEPSGGRLHGAEDTGGYVGGAMLSVTGLKSSTT